MELIIPLLFILLLSHPAHSQAVNDSCHTATEIYPNLDGDFICLAGTTKEATPDELSNYPCVISGFPTVWYKIVLEYYPSFINLHISTDVRHTAIIRVFSTTDDCSGLLSVPIGPNYEGCLSGINGKLKLIGLETEGYTTYYVAVTILKEEGADFELCVTYNLQDLACVREKEIFYENLSSINRIKGPFHPGDEVQVCMSVPVFSGANTGCQWFQGLVPVFGAGWDYTSFDGNWQPENATMNGYEIGQPGNGLYGTATWDWFTDVGYHRYNPYYQIGDLDTNGTVDMCSSLFDPYCPNLGGVFGGCCSPCWDNPGERLPPGWFAYGINGSCPTPGPPVGVDWGDGNSCGSNKGPWEFCFQLTVQEFPECSVYGNSLDLSLGFYTFSDGETGSWTGTSTICSFDQPAHVRLPALCFTDTRPADTIPIIVCKGDSLILPLLDYTVNDALINFWHLDEQYFPGIAPDTYLVPDDTLKFYFNNTSQVVQTRYLRVNGYQGEQTICAHLLFKVLIYPVIDASFSFQTHGLGVQFNNLLDVDSFYYWSFGDSTFSFNEDPYHVYQEEGIYQVELILNTQCGNDTSYREVNLIRSLPQVSFNYGPHHICVGDTVYFASDIIGYIDSIQWTFEGGAPSQITSDIAAISYTLAGVYDVMLIASNQIGSDTLLVQDAVFVDSVPDLKYHVDVYDSLLVFTYTGSPVSSVYWDLGNGVIAHGTTATKIYEGPGQYPVVLYVINACGLDSIPFSVTIKVTSPPIVSFTYSPQHICVGDTVHFISDIIGDTDSIQWTFEGGMPNQITTDTAIVFYGMPGLYDVMLTATNVIGSDTLLLSDAIRVDSAPELKYHVEVYDSLLVFTYTGDKVDSVFWDLGNGIIAHGITVTKIYEGAGEYPVTLYASGVCGLDSIPFSVTIQTTSVRIESFEQYSLFPNPASGKVHIKRMVDVGAATIEIYNVVGQQITGLDWPSEQQLFSIDLHRSGINPGTFYILVKTGKGCFIAPLIVQ